MRALACVCVVVVLCDFLRAGVEGFVLLRGPRAQTKSLSKRFGLEGAGALSGDQVDIADCALATEGTIACDGLFEEKQKAGESQPKPASVWETFGEIAAATQACNLGQGFPDWKPPEFMLQSLREAVETDFHQYTRPAGHPPLVKLLGERCVKSIRDEGSLASCHRACIYPQHNRTT